jgi:Fur family ferric uptake transcriptional regulator
MVSDVTRETLDEEVATRLRAADQRYTRGRRRLIEALRAGGGPMTIPQILGTNDRLAQSSVYRNLIVLEEVGAVTRIVTGDDFARYELAEDLTEHHHHLICSSCGDVSDFSLQPSIEAELERALRNVARRSSFTTAGHRLDLVGVCASCA